MAAPAVLWRVADTTALFLVAVKQLEIGLYAQVLAGAGSLYQAIAAGTGSTCWAKVADSTDDPADLDVRLDTLGGQRVRKATLTVVEADLTDADGSQTFAFAAALPATAIILGAGIRVTAGFTDGVAGVFTADMGINGGDIDAFIDGAAIGAIANVGSPVGVRPIGMVGAITPAITVLADVNVNTATVGILVAEVYYIEAANLD